MQIANYSKSGRMFENRITKQLVVPPCFASFSKMTNIRSILYTNLLKTRKKKHFSTGSIIQYQIQIYIIWFRKSYVSHICFCTTVHRNDLSQGSLPVRYMKWPGKMSYKLGVIQFCIQSKLQMKSGQKENTYHKSPYFNYPR